jgi:hypothetical protein
MKQRQICDIHYCRTFTSLLISLGYIFKLKIKKINFLIIPSQSFNSNHFNKKIFVSIKPFLDKHFDKIMIINYERILKNNQFSWINSIRSQSIKKNLKKTKINLNKFYVENVFSGGDDFESILIKKLGYKPNFYFTEHGDGNLVGAIKDHRNFLSLQKYLLKTFVISSLQKFLFLFNKNFFYPVKYQAYIGVLQKNVLGKIFINDIFALDRIYVDLRRVIEELSKFIEQKKIIKYNSNKKYVLFSYSTISLSKNKEINFKLFKKIKSIIKKDHVIIFKGHPSYRSHKTEKFIKSLIIFLKQNKIKTLVIKKNNLIHNIPSQILVELMSIKILISDISTAIFHISNIFQKIVCYLPLNFSINNRSDGLPLKKSKYLKEYYKKIGKYCNFID